MQETVGRRALPEKPSGAPLGDNPPLKQTAVRSDVQFVHSFGAPERKPVKLTRVTALAVAARATVNVKALELFALPRCQACLLASCFTCRSIECANASNEKGDAQLLSAELRRGA